MTTEWHHVLGVTYPARAELLEPHLPAGAEIDVLDGSPQVSLVAFGFRRTRLRGIPIPGHVTFPEINLRFYVTLGGERAVVFIREFVPRPAIAFVASAIFNEPYRTIPMRAEVLDDAAGKRVGLRHQFGRRRRNRIEAWGDAATTLPDPGSAEYWLTHHDLGIGRARGGRTRVYRVEHPVWALHAVRDLHLDVDFGALYGDEWGHLAQAEPSHVTLAAGSVVHVSLPMSPAMDPR
ncbi:MAG: uncharacterized protein QOG62_2157 [Thermoleophilaceae bacterium]|jgi:uncharacterized protein YqjF (DUF2071 family)|nr:uncharacterized protein [Thermoleophilaceae bacterium]